MKKHIFFILICNIFVSINIHANSLNDVAEIEQALQRQRIVLTEKYVEMREKCQNSTRGFQLDYVGLEPINRALGSRDNIYCSQEEKLQGLLESNKLKLLKISAFRESIMKKVSNEQFNKKQ